MIVPISSGGETIGSVAMLVGDDSAADHAGELLHLAALATVTVLALEEAREHAAARLGAGLIEELRGGEIEGVEIVRRAARLGCDLVRGAVVLVMETGASRPRQAMALLASEYPGSISELVEDRVYAVLPARGGDEAPELTVNAAAGLAGRLRRYGKTGISSFYADPTELQRAIQEAELVCEVVSRDERMAEQLANGMGSGVYRLLFRALASHPEEVRSFYEDTVAAIVRYDQQYHTELLGTLEAYLANDCNMNGTARAIYAHRHTVAYRLQRVKELTSLDPMISEDRERLSLGLKAYRIVAPTLPR
jgi:sugar diacid utilization regulator